jgi:hypothetical protein
VNAARGHCARSLGPEKEEEHLPAKLIFALTAAKKNVIRHNTVRL